MTRYCECADCFYQVPFETEDSPRTLCRGCQLGGCRHLMLTPSNYHCCRVAGERVQYVQQEMF